MARLASVLRACLTADSVAGTLFSRGKGVVAVVVGRRGEFGSRFPTRAGALQPGWSGVLTATLFITGGSPRGNFAFFRFFFSTVYEISRCVYLCLQNKVAKNRRETQFLGVGSFQVMIPTPHSKIRGDATGTGIGV